MSETIDAARLAEQLPELLERAQAGEHFVIAREGRPVAQLNPPAGVAPQLPEAEREAALMRDLEERGILARREVGPIIPFSERPLFKVQGKPVSEAIIEDRDWTP